MTYDRLIRQAQKARAHSHSPFSRFRVGSAVLTTTGRIFTGCNIENSSFGLTICAERTALFKAVSEGHSKFKAIAITTDEVAPIAPCGACRQVIMDLAGDIDVIMVGRNGTRRVVRLTELFPFPFGPDNLLKRKKPGR